MTPTAFRCPYPSCRSTLEFAAGSLRVPGVCPHCGGQATFRPVESIERLERIYEKRKESGLLAGGPPPGDAAFSALVEDVRSLWNVGSIFRTSDGAGFSLLYLCGITGCPPRQEIAKTSLGAEQSVSWQYHLGALDVLPQLKARQVQIVGLERSRTSEPLSAAVERRAIKTPLCLVVGNEVSGLSIEALAFCDIVCHLPMRGIKESLNVAVAYGIASYMLAENLEAGAFLKNEEAIQSSRRDE